MSRVHDAVPASGERGTSGTPIRLAVIVASTREGRFGPTVARWFVDQAAPRTDLRIDVVDLGGPPDSSAGVSERLAAADAFVIVTPEYNHSFPGPLKDAIDAHFTEWQAKPVAFVSYGGISGGLRAVEQLRPVFAELHAVTVRFAMAWERFDEAGLLTDPEAPAAAARQMLDQLVWWSHALREARARRTYGA